MPQEKGKINGIESKPINKDLLVDLNPQELQNYSDQLADLVKEADRIECDKKNSARVFKRQLDKNIELQNSIAEKISTRQENRKITCKWIYNIVTKKMDLRRDDTGEFIETRDLTNEEMQIQMDLGIFRYSDNADEDEESDLKENKKQKTLPRPALPSK